MEKSSDRVTRIARAWLQDRLRASLAVDTIPFECAAAPVPEQLQSRFRPYIVAMPHCPNEEFSWGYDEIRNYKTLIVVVLFSDVAADYHLRQDVFPAFIERLNQDSEAGAFAYDNYGILRKEAATLLGLGQIGRNGLFFSRKFGFNCKIDLVLSKLELAEEEPTPGILRKQWKLGPCAACDLCVPACPVGAYQDFRLLDVLACEKHITADWYQPERMCRSCITSCPESEKLLTKLQRGGHARWMTFEQERAASENFQFTGTAVLDRNEERLELRSKANQAVLLEIRDGALIRLIEWMAGRRRAFSKSEIAAKFPEIAVGAIAEICQRLVNISVLAGYVPSRETWCEV
jgi:ferredoxin